MIWLSYLIISIILMSFNVFYIKKLVKRLNPLVILLYQYIIAIPLVYLYSFIVQPIELVNYSLSLLGLIYVAGIALFYIALKKGSLSKVSTVFNMKMIVTALLGVIILAEPLTLQLIIGLLFGAVSVYLLGGGE